MGATYQEGGFKLKTVKAFKCQIPGSYNDLSKMVAQNVGMSSHKYIEKKIIGSHVMSLAKKIVTE